MDSEGPALGARLQARAARIKFFKPTDAGFRAMAATRASLVHWHRGTAAVRVRPRTRPAFFEPTDAGFTDDSDGNRTGTRPLSVLPLYWHRRGDLALARRAFKFIQVGSTQILQGN